METVVLTADDEAQAIVESFGIPPCPEILVKVIAEMRREDPDFVKIGNLVTGDVSLAAAVLKTVNSPFFGLRNKVKSVDQALKLLGVRNVKQITTGLLLRDALPVGDNVVLGKFWDTSAAIAQTAALLAQEVSRIDRDDAYTFALFRDCGIPLMARRFDEYDHFFLESATGEEPITEIETRTFGTDHARVGAHLAKTWYLPEDITNAIALHHARSALFESGVSAATRRLVALALVAETVHTRLTTGTDCAEWGFAGGFALDVLDLSEEDLAGHQDFVEGILCF
ncbi:MAG: HDOD domain-containing protein [Betaproteobacteria bacterium]|nr:HDOD domain-containing protein [Betaproteobacteria bacterium]